MGQLSPTYWCCQRSNTSRESVIHRNLTARGRERPGWPQASAGVAHVWGGWLVFFFTLDSTGYFQPLLGEGRSECLAFMGPEVLATIVCALPYRLWPEPFLPFFLTILRFFWVVWVHFELIWITVICLIGNLCSSNWGGLFWTIRFLWVIWVSAVCWDRLCLWGSFKTITHLLSYLGVCWCDMESWLPYLRAGYEQEWLIRYTERQGYLGEHYYCSLYNHGEC